MDYTTQWDHTAADAFNELTQSFVFAHVNSFNFNGNTLCHCLDFLHKGGMSVGRALRLQRCPLRARRKAATACENEPTRTATYHPTNHMLEHTTKTTRHQICHVATQ